MPIAEPPPVSDSAVDNSAHQSVHVAGQRSIRFESGGPTPAEVIDFFRAQPPGMLGGSSVVEIDESSADDPLHSASVLVGHLEQCTFSLRPSVTGVELELHCECWRPTTIETPAARRQLLRVLDDLGSFASDPERATTKLTLDLSRPGDDDLGARAEALFGSEPALIGRQEALRLTVASIDLTTLAGDDTNGRVRALCAQARRPDPADDTVGPTAAVCVYPNLVAVAAELTKDSGVVVASVAGAFPSGLSSLEVRLSDIAEAICAGADEVDVVLNRAAFLAGHYRQVSDELRAMREQIGSRKMKVILETGELITPAAIQAAAELAMQAGADWIKTSTGKSGTGATPVAVLVMAEAIAAHVRAGADPVGLKISGGVRTSADALGYLAIIEHALGTTWLHPDRIRFGASGLLSTVVADIGPALN